MRLWKLQKHCIIEKAIKGVVVRADGVKKGNLSIFQYPASKHSANFFCRLCLMLLFNGCLRRSPQWEVCAHKCCTIQYVTTKNDLRTIRSGNVIRQRRLLCLSQFPPKMCVYHSSLITNVFFVRNGWRALTAGKYTPLKRQKRKAPIQRGPSALIRWARWQQETKRSIHFPAKNGTHLPRANYGRWLEN